VEEVIESYYRYFNQGNWEGMLSLLDESISHEVNQGDVQKGKKAFSAFLGHMEDCYKEKLEDIVVMVNNTKKRASAEFIVNGEYIKTDGSLPKANGQKYVLPAGTFFEVNNGLITRITTYYNLPLWIKMVS
jgi:steroid delta-isomerase-like uncharacterized protein